MSTRLPRRGRVRLAVGVAAAALLVTTACSSKQEAASPSSTTALAATTTAAGKGNAAPTSAAGDASASSTTSTTSTTLAEEVGNPEIKAALSASDPELWALVNYDLMSWEAFGGFNIPLKPGADASKAVALCQAVAKVVHPGSPDTPIVVSVDVSVSDLIGKPVAKIADKSDTCKAV
jgi:hypothetical protein